MGRYQFVFWTVLLIWLGEFTASAQTTVTVSDKEKVEYARPVAIPFPANNPYTLEKATLGKMLFFDQRLSGAQNMSCSSCHNPSFGWEVPVSVAIGAQNTPLPRHAPTVIGGAWGERFFWDGRAASLEEQAGGPIENPEEMNLTFAELIERLENIPDYRRAFELVFQGEGVSKQNILKAIATFERTIVPNVSPFDLWIEGDETAISEAAKRGFVIFTGKGECSACHTGWNFTDNKFHDIGLPSDDIGRFKEDPTQERNRFAFKTPSLRNLTQRAPFMHDGSLADITEVLFHYVSGGIERPSRSELMKAVDINDREIEDLAAFLTSLTAQKDEVVLPILPN